MRICLIASSRFPVSEPFHGGLEAHTAALAHRLMERGHAVTVFAAPGSDARLNVDALAVPAFAPSAGARADVAAPPEVWLQEHHAYLGLMLRLIDQGPQRFDVIHNNSLHHLPIAMATATGLPIVTTLHTPPVPWLESAMTYAPVDAMFVAVSEHTAQAWRHAIDPIVVLNGIDTQVWRPGAGGGGAVWTGRVVPEKAPHLAIRAALRAGLPIDVAGPVMDPVYFHAQIAPLLGPSVRFLGHLDTARLVQLVGSATVAIVSPTWDEPYGLVAAEAMSCGTPVAAFARGALPELVRPGRGVLARPDDVDDLASAARAAAGLDRSRVRDHAVEEFSLDRMVDSYESLYERSHAGRAAA